MSERLQKVFCVMVLIGIMATITQSALLFGGGVAMVLIGTIMVFKAGEPSRATSPEQELTRDTHEVIHQPE